MNNQVDIDKLAERLARLALHHNNTFEVDEGPGQPWDVILSDVDKINNLYRLNYRDMDLISNLRYALKTVIAEIIRKEFEL